MFTLTTRSTTTSSGKVPVEGDNDTTGCEVPTHLWRWARIRHDQKYRTLLPLLWCLWCVDDGMAWHGSSCTCMLLPLLLPLHLRVPTLAIFKLSHSSFILGTSDPLLCPTHSHLSFPSLSHSISQTSHRVGILLGTFLSFEIEAHPGSPPVACAFSRLSLLRSRTKQFVFPRGVNEI